MFEIATIIAVTTATVEVIKRATGLQSRYAPLLALIVGILLSILAQHQVNADIIFTGIIVGLSASGAYAGTKTTLKK